MPKRNAYVSEAAEAKRVDALASIKDMAKIKAMPKEQIVALLGAFGFGNVYGRIEIPRDYMPAGKRRLPSGRIFDFREVLAGKDRVLLAVMRVICLRWLIPMGTATEPCTGSTFAKTVGTLRRICTLLVNTPDDSLEVWGRLTYEDVATLLSGNALDDVVNIFRTLVARKLLDDTIRLPARRWPGEIERSRKNQPEPESNAKKKNPYLPLADVFVSEFGWRCAWLAKNLGPLLLDVMESIYKSCEIRTDQVRKEAIRDFNAAASRKLGRRKWIDSNGAPLAIPFEIRLTTRHRKARGEQSAAMPWPPETLPDLWQLVSLLQGAHIFIVALSGGPRAGELLSIKKSALKTVRGKERVEGRTYKLVFNEQGKERDWPAPQLTIAAVSQQVRLAGMTQLAAKRYGNIVQGDHLWVLLAKKDLSKCGLPLNDIDSILWRMVKVFNLVHLFDSSSTRDRRLHPHRIRKATGRLVGLALSNGLHALMDLFGHEDPEMTVAYLLSNPDIAEEAKAVANAQTIMFASEAISDSANNSGNAAKHVKESAAAYAKLRGKSSLDASDIDELARDLTENGRYWELVRPGVLCTKLPGQTGKCNGSPASPDSSRCRVGCGYRLERAAERENVDRTIERQVEHLERAIKEDEPLVAERWRGQIVANLFRFESVKAKWASHPRIAEIIAMQKGESYGG